MEGSDAKNIITVASEQDISSRLAALNRWQEEQKRLLIERQNNQRVMLGLEHRNMYQVLGLLHEKLQSIDDSTVSTNALEGNDNENEGQEAQQQSFAIEFPRHVNQESEDGQNEQNFELPENVAGQDSQLTTKPKRPFLRRGEGLKQRFKVDPDRFRLDNLPRYKFANAHPQYRAQSLGKRKQCNALKPNKNLDAIEKLPTIPQLDTLSIKEQRFQQLIMNAEKVCSSTPDQKSSYASTSNTNSNSSPNVHFRDLVTDQAKGQSADDERSSGDSSNALVNMCWAKVLDSQQIKPPVLHRRTAQICVENDENVSIFELLEQKAREGNIDMNSSCIRTFMARKEQRRQADADDSDQIIITREMRNMRLQPEVSDVISETDEDTDDNENTTIVNTPVKISTGKTKVHVRFSDSTDTREYSDETTLQDTTNVQLFEEFKAALFQALEQNKTKQIKPTAGDEPLTQELQIKANLVRTRLEELETEIAMFKEQNTQLLRLKQQHELEKAKCAQDHLEAMERVHDEKIQAEIYLHDERMKIEEERRKFEQQMRLQKSNVNSKEKKELAALKQEVEALQLQLKQKEQAHVSAQARLRAQLRAAEKEQRSYRDEIELLNRENKRLEQELVKATRENNSKMLKEINRNIARLAPKLESTLPAAKHADENGKRQNKSITEILNDNAEAKLHMTTCRHSCGRTRKKVDRDESYASSSESDTDKDVPFLPVKPTTSASKSAETIVGQRKKSNEHNNNNNNNNNNDNNNNDNNNNNNNIDRSTFKREIVNADGSKDIWYPNGNLKKISADGMNVSMLYFNKDIKQTDIRAGTVKYYYAETNTWHTSYLDGLEILEFPNGQTEHRHKNGIVEIHFPNNTIKIVDPSDKEKLEEWRYADGTQLVQLRNGDKILNLPNGQKEIHTKLNRRREYPDGTVKIVYPDGSQETRYSNGRVRLKDKDGNLIMDTDYAKY